MRKADPNVLIEHKNINSPPLLEGAIKDSNIVVFFTHDYHSMTIEKNSQLKQAAEICKAYNVEKLIAVNPIEHINYYNSNGFTDDPLNEETAAQDESIKIFPNTSVLRSNVVYGSRSYLIRFLTQNWMNNFAPFESANFKHYRFNPM